MMIPYALRCRGRPARWSALPAALALGAGVFAVGALAAGEPYGEDFAREGVSWAEGGPPPALLPPLPDAAEAPAAPELEALQARLEALEAEGGPYAGGLDEPLAALGRALAARGRYGEAVAAYRRALHVLRVNDGLYGEAQKPLLAALLSLYRAAGDYATLDEQYPWFFRVYGNGQPPLTGLRLEAALAYQRWQREALRRKLGDGTRRLLSLLELGEELLARVEAESGAVWAARRDLALAQLRNFYLLEEQVAPPPEDYPGLVTMDPYRRNDFLGRDLKEEQLQAVRRTAEAKGRRLLEDVAAAAPDAVARADVLVALGDWQQWHGRESAAREVWQEAYAAFVAAGALGRAELLFGSPRELPDNGVFWQPPAPEPDAPRPLVEARFEVDARGRARRVEAESVVGRESAYIGVVRALRRLRFRPRFEGGEPVATPVQRRYEVY